MADLTFPTLTGAISFGSTFSLYTDENFPEFSVSVSNGTVSIGNFDFSENQKTMPGHLTGRRPAKGLVFPRGVYNK